MTADDFDFPTVEEDPSGWARGMFTTLYGIITVPPSAYYSCARFSDYTLYGIITVAPSPTFLSRVLEGDNVANVTENMSNQDYGEKN